MGLAKSLIAFSGIDGAGKTSVIRELMLWSPLRDSLSFRKDRSPMAQRVYASLGARLRDPATFMDNDFARSIARAYALDFSTYYHRTMAPVISAAPHSTILADRWTICVEAVATMAGDRSGEIVALCRAMPPPSVVVHLDVNPEVARRRLELRGRAKPDENVEVLRALQRAYREVIHRHEERHGIDVVTVVNRDFEATVARVKEVIQPFVSS